MNYSTEQDAPRESAWYRKDYDGKLGIVPILVLIYLILRAGIKWFIFGVLLFLGCLGVAYFANHY